MVLCRNGHENPDGATYCSVCKVYIDASAPPAPEPPPPEPEPPPAPARPPEPEPPPPLPAPPPRQAEAPMVTLSQAELSVIAGDRVPAAIEIANPGEVDDEYVVEVHGEAAQWTSVEPAQLALAAGAAATVQLWFQPVASASPGAVVPFEVSVRSRQLPVQKVVLTGGGAVG